jgi:hypothetical protein
MNTRTAAVAFGLLLCTSCGGQAHQSAAGAGAGNAADASTPDAQAGGGGGAGGGARGGACGSAPIPKEHRAVAQACPSERGSLAPIDTTACVDRSGINCTSNADCTAGKNGRCFSNGDPCQTKCSYDDCLADSDCAAGPCVCRSSGTDLASNACVPGSNCRTDGDCGGCEYCSPSVVPDSEHCLIGGVCTCGSGVVSLVYACHTASDECTNNGDCPGSNSAYCGYDAGAQHWACGVCTGTPHP